MVMGLAAFCLSFGLACVRRRPGKNQPGEDKPMPEESDPSKPAALQRIAEVLSPREKHWVGDGFLVSTIFSPQRLDAQMLSPFILMDHAAPRSFPPSDRRRGVGEHPHRGFETVTFAYQGEVDHRDSHGGGGTIEAGGVQWMTAASGVVHEEMHSQRFTATGGIFEMVQLWVNLPADFKMSAPRYQSLKGSTFPALKLGQASGRLIAGTMQGLKGPAMTYSPVTLFDIDCAQTTTCQFELAPETTTLLFMLRGQAQVQRSRQASAGELVVLDRASRGAIELELDAGTRILVLNGKPLNEPVVAHGPFVMNTRQEIIQANQDYRRGLMGTLAPTL